MKSTSIMSSEVSNFYFITDNEGFFADLVLKFRKASLTVDCGVEMDELERLVVGITDDMDVESGICEVVELVGTGVVLEGVGEEDVDAGFGILLVVVGSGVGGIEVVEGGLGLLVEVLVGGVMLDEVGFVEDELVLVGLFVAEYDEQALDTSAAYTAMVISNLALKSPSR